MKALLKDEAGAGLALIDRPDPIAGTGRRRRPRAAHRHLRHGPAHPSVGRLGRLDGERAAGPGPRILRRGGRGRHPTSATSPRVTGCPAKVTSCAAPAATAGPAGGTCASAQSVSGSSGTGRSPSTWRCRPATSGCTTLRHRRPRWAPSSTPSATPCTRPWPSRSSARTCWSAGCGPIGLMAIAVARHVGARYVVGTDVSGAAAGTGPADGRRRGRRRRRARSIRDAQSTLGLREGFDVGFEMSGAPAALPEMIDNMNHGGRVAHPRSADHPVRRRLGQGRHPHADAQGHLRAARCSRPGTPWARCCRPARRCGNRSPR